VAGIPAAAPPHAPEPASNRDKHLQKPKPPALAARKPGPTPDLGATDPNLKKFQQQSGGGGLKTMLIVLIFVLIGVVLLVVLTLFVPAVRALLPIGLQQQIEGMVGGPPAQAPAPVPVPVPVKPEAAVPTPAPAAPVADPATAPVVAPVPPVATPAPEAP